MHPEAVHVGTATQLLREHLGDPPALAIVLGSGLGPVVERVDIRARADYATLGIPDSTIVGHENRAYRGRLGGAEVVVLSGRIHLYEGFDPGVVVRAVRAVHGWGVGKLVLTCSAGGIADGFDPGRVVAVSDHINLQGLNPLTGPSWNGNRFPDLSKVHDVGMRDVFHRVARENGIELGEGVYAGMNGPGYETPAEIRMLRTCGADLVGMSTVPELLAAAQLGLPAAALAVVSNRAAGLDESVLDHHEVTEVAGRAARSLAVLLEAACGHF